jgi:iron complex outermembrane receptor protein
MKRSFYGVLVGCGLMAAVAIALADNAQPAQTPSASTDAAADNDIALQEVVVTARRRTEELQDVPLTVTAVGADTIQNQDVTSIQDLGSFVPNMKISQDRATSSTINVYIRGVGQSDPLWGFEPGVGVYIDDVYMARPQAALLDVIDVQRLEVLSGPQGTLYGKNTIAGAIKYVTRDIDGPATATASATVGNYNEHDFKLGASTPLIDDHVYFGVSFGSLQHSGYGEVLAQPGAASNPSVGEQLSNKDILVGRANLTIKWGESSKLRLIADDILDNSNASGGQRLNDLFAGQLAVPGGIPLPASLGGGTTFAVVYPNAQPLSNPFDSYDDLPANKDFFHRDGVSATYTQSLTSQLDLKLVGAYYQGHGQQFINFSETDDNLFNVPAEYHDQQSSAEAQLTFTNDLVTAVGGVFYMDSTACGAFNATIGTLPLLGVPLDDLYVTELVSGCVLTRSGAVYGDTSWKLTDSLNLDAGLRWNEDRKTASVFQEDWLSVAPDQLLPGDSFFNPAQAPAGFIASPGIVTNYTNARSYVNVTPRAGLDYHFTRDIMAYFTYSRGFKSGGFDMRGDALLFPGTSNGYQSETADSYELGIKSTLFDQRLLLDADVFYNPYSNAQIEIAGTTLVGQSVQNLQVADNAGKQINKGAELQAAWRATRALTVALNAGYLDSYFEQFLIPCNIFAGATQLGCTTGLGVANEASVDRPLNAPHWTLSENQTYSWDLPYGTLMARAGFDYRSFAHTAAYVDSVTDQPGYGLINAGLAFTTTNKAWRLSVDGKNLTNKDYRVAGYDFGPGPVGPPSFTGGVSQIGFYGPPRTFGATLTYHY